MTTNQEKFSTEELAQKMDTLNGWEIQGTEKIYKHFSFKNFKQALDFTNKVGAVAEEIQHHPEIYLTWGKVKIEILTHEAAQLTQADFDLAAKIDQIE